MENVTCQHHNAEIWTRDKYTRAARMARFLDRRYNLLDAPVPPPLLDRYYRLWSRYPSGLDPLTVPMSQRRRYDTSIPF